MKQLIPLLLLVACTPVQKPVEIVHIPEVKTELDYKTLGDHTVAIVTHTENSGGTGVILQSTPSVSFILTNRHVCEAIKTGGYVVLDNGEKFEIAAFKESIQHDLCVVEIFTNLKLHTDVALVAPIKYEKAVISGHPQLYPTVITTGHFSGRKTIQVMMGVKDCTKDDFKDSRYGLFCLISGKMPDIKTFDSILVTALIMAGSSGSAIYNERGEIAALVFAGGQDGVGYTFAVPYEYIISFLDEELKQVALQVPHTEVTKKLNDDQVKERFEQVCKKIKTKQQKEVCEMLEGRVR